jgi:Ion channel
VQDRSAAREGGLLGHERRTRIGRTERTPESSKRGTRWKPANSLFVHIDLERRFETWYERLTLPRAVATVIAVATTLVLLAGLLARIVEPEVFTSIGLAYWWAVVTVTTVGYGDVVPESTGGRLVATMLMLTGLGLIPTLTSVVVSTLIGKRTRVQHDELTRQGEEHAEALARIEAHLTRLSEDKAGQGRTQPDS